ncbi:hypothetical protein MN0502_26300 [Arthrobacter sp. MN05-02]|nr:hypothetical protein MN0502_26300 [Arthrobacter sp. MN05-02]
MKAKTAARAVAQTARGCRKKDCFSSARTVAGCAACAWVVTRVLLGCVVEFLDDRQGGGQRRAVVVIELFQ